MSEDDETDDRMESKMSAERKQGETDGRMESKMSAADASKINADADDTVVRVKGKNDDLPFGPPRTFDPSFTPVCFFPF